MGADVVKVEPPEGDWARLMSVARHGSSTLSLPANLGKRSVCVDARTAEGKTVLRRLAEQADVVVESFRPGVLSKLGLGFDTLQNLRHDIVLASISGFGATGPYSRRPGSDSIIQAISGMAFMNQTSEGAPKRVGMLAVDMVAGLYAGFALSAAIFDQRMNGSGRHLELSLMEAAAAFQITPLLESLVQGGKRSTPVTVPSGLFPTRSGSIAVVCLHDKMFAALCETVGRPEWVEDMRFRDNRARQANAQALHAELGAVLASGDGKTWIERFNTAGVLCGQVNDYADIVEDEQARYLDLFTTLETRAFGDLPFVRLPGGGLGAEVLGTEPMIGENTRQVLSDIGFPNEQIDQLLAAQVCHQAKAP